MEKLCFLLVKWSEVLILNIEAAAETEKVYNVKQEEITQLNSILSSSVSTHGSILTG